MGKLILEDLMISLVGRKRAKHKKKIALAALIPLLLTLNSGYAAEVYKCVSKDGKATYSDSPCSDSAKTVPSVKKQFLDVKSMTQSQADVASDCTEVLNLEHERAAFNRYCGVFGFRVPWSAEHLSFNKKFGETLIERLRQRFESVPSISRTYSGADRTPPYFYHAELAMQERPVAQQPGAAKPVQIPTVQSGSWKLNAVIDGKTSEHELCGNPLEQVTRMAKEARDFTKAGCSVSTPVSGSTNFRIVVDCPKDWVSQDGSSRIPKGRAEISISAPTAQSFSYDVIRNVSSKRQTVKGVRVGNC